NPLGRTIQTASTLVGAVFLWAFLTLYPSRLCPLMVLQRPLPSLLQSPHSHFFLPVSPRDRTASKPRCLLLLIDTWSLPPNAFNAFLRGLAAIKKDAAASFFVSVRRCFLWFLFFVDPLFVHGGATVWPDDLLA
ncbi:hypothetical protein ACE1BJ_04925, partial [Aeromonas jandaei]